MAAAAAGTAGSTFEQRLSVRRRVGLGIAMVALQGISTYVQYSGNVISFLYHAKACPGALRTHRALAVFVVTAQSTLSVITHGRVNQQLA